MQSCLTAFHIRPMTKSDLHQVGDIDREAFPTMWPPVNFNHELTNRLAHYLVATSGAKPSQPPVLPVPPPPPRSLFGLRLPFLGRKAAAEPETGEFIAGFLGMWLMVDEAHIINVAVREKCRRRGLGELLIISGIDLSARLNANVVTLEVRTSNLVAQNLYTKYGFNNVGVRKKYYTDNNEDALIMTTEPLSDPAFREKFQKLKEAHFKKLGLPAD